MCCAADDRTRKATSCGVRSHAAAGSLPTANTLHTAHVLVARDAVRSTARIGPKPVILKMVHVIYQVTIHATRCADLSLN
ncbi:MAG: hypothetical protein DWH97_01740 [Planctomycetota bacterium]|nr:MAG: hypothetical protein DWH97_01740 [Planctomycetota bacterium]RLS95027.1 MAG: hypothetical protein DWI12_05450 [Planctomycetota bacterium]